MKNTICIVGHGTSISGNGKGEMIDGHDIVIRMVECDWQLKRIKDYGTKYDIGIFGYGKSQESAVNSPRLPALKWWFYNSNEKNPKVMQADEEGVFRSIPIIKLQRTIWKHADPDKKKFSRGLSAVFASLQYLDPRYITLVGFDSVEKGASSKKHHPAELIKFLGGNVNKNTHDWANERKQIDKLNAYYEKKQKGNMIFFL